MRTSNVRGIAQVQIDRQLVISEIPRRLCRCSANLLFIAGLLYLLRFERVDNLGAHSIPSETGPLIPSIDSITMSAHTPE